VAAIDKDDTSTPASSPNLSNASAILLAALALPGVVQAESAPESASLSVKYLHYQDSQPNLDRIKVSSPSLDLLLPIAGEWSLRVGLVSDSISGASPRYHTAVSGASRFDDKRRAVDVAVTRYLARASVSVAAGRSGENDYVSKFASVQASMSSDDNNTTWLVGTGVANDRINPVNFAVTDQSKRTVDLMAGVTQVVTARDLVQLVLTHARGSGYYSMPYKYVDIRPREHDQSTLQLRWNHHIEKNGASSRMGYRYYTDDYGIRSHTFSEEVVHPLHGGWTLTPSLRLHTQSKARFYIDPVYDTRFGAPFPPNYKFGSDPITADQRLSAFGAVTVGLKVEKEIAKNTTLDLKWEQYKQRGAWRQFGNGSPGLQDFSARSIQLGMTTHW
jgi:hypothetical protein